MSAPRVELVSNTGMPVESIHSALALCARLVCGYSVVATVTVEPPSPSGCIRVTATYPDDSSFTLLVDRDTWRGALRLQVR